MKTFATCVIALSLLAPAAALAGPATAPASSETMSLRVSYAGLDLAHQPGAGVMLRRLDRAALTACGASPFSFRDVQNEVRASGCYQHSMDRAVADLSAPTVTAAYRASAGHYFADN